MRKALLLSLLITVALFSCNKMPEACIEVDNSAPAAGTPITFTSCSKKALSYVWSMEGPTGAPENDIQWSESIFTRAFSVAGTYTITLDAYEKFSWNGQSNSTTTTITVQ